MLALDDSRWSCLTSFFGDGTDIPVAISTWLESIGTDDEIEVYDEGIFELVLHQLTITNGALAFVPWLLHACSRTETEFRLKYLRDIAVIEANRVAYGLYYNREGTDPFPDWLMGPYMQAISVARLVALDFVALDRDAAWESGLLALMPAFESDGQLAWEQWRKRYGINTDAV